MTLSQRSRIQVTLQTLNIVLALLVFPVLVLNEKGWLVGLQPLLLVFCVIIIVLEVTPSLVRIFDHGNPVTLTQQWIAKAAQQLKQLGWQQLLGQVGMGLLIIAVLGVVCLPAITMALYGTTHPDYSQKYLTQQPLLPSFFLLVFSTSQKVGHLGNEAKAIVNQSLQQLSRVLKWSTFIVLALSLLCYFWVPSHIA
jgi:hypothetical protein